MGKIVVTNLRIEAQKYAALRALAGEAGVSVNEYLNNIIEEANRKVMFEDTPKKTKKQPKKNFYDAMMELATRKTEDKPMGANEDDKIIYGIED